MKKEKKNEIKQGSIITKKIMKIKKYNNNQ